MSEYSNGSWPPHTDDVFRSDDGFRCDGRSSNKPCILGGGGTDDLRAASKTLADINGNLTTLCSVLKDLCVALSVKV